MGINYQIFTLKPTEFEQGQRDPFGFDDFTEKLGSKYLPFSGTVRKPVYFFFVAYVNWLWDNIKLNIKKREEARLRLEKLLVLSWKRNSENLVGENVLGNRQKKINPFKGNDGNWITQTCFKIYGASVSKLISDNKFIEQYVKDNLGEEKILNEFLGKEGLLDTRNEIFLEKILQKLENRKNSLFSGKHQLINKYRKKFLNYLKEEIRKTNQDYYKDIFMFFTPTNNLKERLYKKTIENEKKYPFKAFNNWFTTFILAVEKDIKKEDSKKDWVKADNLFLKIPASYRRDLKNRPEPRCWFERNGNKYDVKQGKDFDEDGWSALIKRAERKYFYDFKHFALISLLQEIY